MLARTFYVIRVYDRAPRGLRLVETIPAADETACLHAAHALAQNYLGAVALKVKSDEHGRQTTTEIGRYGKLQTR